MFKVNSKVVKIFDFFKYIFLTFFLSNEENAASTKYNVDLGQSMCLNLYKTFDFTDMTSADAIQFVC